MSVSFGDFVGSIPCERESEVTIPWYDTVTGMLTPALWWAENVCGIFPLTECNNATAEHPGKTPALSGGANDPSRRLRDPDEIERLWTWRPWMNPGVVTLANGFLVLDIDPRDGGSHSLIEWFTELGLDLSQVPRDASPRADGGCHLWWKLPADAPPIKCGSPLDGIDIPWQVPVPPSLRHVEVGNDHRGKPIMKYLPYVWAAGSPMDLPEAPKELLDSLAALGRVKGIAASRTVVGGKVVDPVTTNVASLLETGIPHGRQNNTVQSLATSMARREVAYEEAVKTILEILNRSPQDMRKPWTYEDLHGYTDANGRFTPGIVARAYAWIDSEREREYAEYKPYADALQASMVAKKRVW